MYDVSRFDLTQMCVLVKVRSYTDVYDVSRLDPTQMCMMCPGSILPRCVRCVQVRSYPDVYDVSQVRSYPDVYDVSKVRSYPDVGVGAVQEGHHGQQWHIHLSQGQGKL